MEKDSSRKTLFAPQKARFSQITSYDCGCLEPYEQVQAGFRDLILNDNQG